MFKIGDRVELTRHIGVFHTVEGDVGTVIGIDIDGTPIIEFDRYVDGHSGEGKVCNGHCVYVKPCYLDYKY